MLIRQFFAQKKCVLSLEVFPPKTEPGWEKLQHLLREAKKMDPSFISITCSAGGSGTAGIPTSQVAAFVKNEVQIEPLTHITCVGSSEADLNDNLQHLMASGIRNIMCLRGDINPELPLHKDFLHASDLAAYIQKHYGCFGLSGACYPQHHPEAASLLEDVQNLKIKEEAGITHLVSQLFFDNTYYYRFTNLARKIGVTSPISVGVMPIAKKVHIKNVVQLSGATIPTRFGAESKGYTPDIEFFPVRKCECTSIALEAGYFAFLTPEDAHRPCIRLHDGKIKKAVFKIKI